MIRKKIEFLMKIVPGKTYEVGDTVTILRNYLPGTNGYGYRLGLSNSMLKYYGGKSFKILEKTKCVSSGNIYTVPDDGYRYSLEDIKGYTFSSGMFRESYRYGKKKD